jgi:mono/diheme cytochrome c family protein
VNIRVATAALARTAMAAACACLLISGTAGAQSSAASALYTDAQAQMGVEPYESACGMCHGANMEGAQGPTLLGDTFTSHYQTVGDLMQFVVKNMPKSDPGSLSHEDYVNILAFILLKNGWSEGSEALSFEAANASKVPLSQAMSPKPP